MLYCHMKFISYFFIDFLDSLLRDLQNILNIILYLTGRFLEKLLQVMDFPSLILFERIFLLYWFLKHRLTWCFHIFLAFAFSPDCQHIALVSQDGLLRIVDFVQEKYVIFWKPWWFYYWYYLLIVLFISNRLNDTFSSYFGGLNCVCWSPDGRYILTGGQDDLVTIWAFREQKIVARCQGHQSWVTGLAFDPWRCDEKNYRFGSVGEDCRLLLWDFSVNALHRPKAVSHFLS